MSITDLEPGAIYEVTAGFRDFEGESFVPGERLTFVGRNYLPYDNGHTLRFLERTIMLEGSDPVAEDLGSHLRLAVPPPFIGRMTIDDLKPGATYEIIDTFLDGDRQWNSAGEKLVFIGRADEPGPAGDHILRFAQRTLRLFRGHDVAKHTNRFLREVNEHVA